MDRGFAGGTVACECLTARNLAGSRPSKRMNMRCVPLSVAVDGNVTAAVRGKSPVFRAFDA